MSQPECINDEMLQVIAQQALAELEVCDVSAIVRRYHRQELTLVCLKEEREGGCMRPRLGDRSGYILQPTIRSRRSSFGGTDSEKEAHC